MEIRDVEAGDFEAIAALTNHYILTTAIHFGTEAVVPAALQAEWEQTREKYPFMVATRGDELLGFAKATTFRTRPAYAQTAEIGVYIAQAHQRSGVGTELVGRLIEACEQRGFHVLIAGMTLPNPGSMRLVESLGFHHVGTFPEIGFKVGRWHDVGFWHLTLGRSPTGGH